MTSRGVVGGTGADNPPGPVLDLLGERFPTMAMAGAARLLGGFWRHRRGYRREFADSLLADARGGQGDPWEVRCLATLMLEHQAALLPPGDLESHAGLFQGLGLMSGRSPRSTLSASVLEEGYSTTRLSPFITEFRRRLDRRGALHRALQRVRPPLVAWRELFDRCVEECTIELARYVFTPKDVVARVLESVRTSEGDDDPPANPPFVRRASDAYLARLPRYEREIAAGLAGRGVVYWADPATSPRLDALVAQPPGTVVLVVRPPGSRLEIEIKRSGRREPLPLGVVAARGGEAVPRSHRLDGGSMIRSLQFEADGAARLEALYRAIWGRSAPVAIAISTRFVARVPTPDGPVDLLDYYHKPEVFGPRFAAMRGELEAAVAAFESEDDPSLPELDGELGLTVRFLHATAPGQSILGGTSCYRLDLLSRLLGGPRASSFRSSTAPEAPRRQAGRWLEQILGSYVSPRPLPRGGRAIVEAAFAVPENRRRADRVFRSLLRQLADFWGTLLAVRGFSHGESLVARNVGIRSTWERGRLRIRLVFMDHDDLHLPTSDREHFRPGQVLPGTLKDEAFAIGKPGLPRHPFSLVDHLRIIYRIGPEAWEGGERALRRRLARAYRRAGRALRDHPSLRRMYSPRFVEEAAVWDRMVALFVSRPRDAADPDSWRAGARELARGHGLDDAASDAYLAEIATHAPFLERSAGLFPLEPRCGERGGTTP